MDGPIMPTSDHSHLLAKRTVEEQEGLPPQLADDLHRVRAVFTVAVILGAIASVTVVILSLM